MFSLGTTICQRFTNVSCLRSHHKEKTGTRSILEVKPCRARIVPGWLTAWKYLLLLWTLYCWYFLFLLHDEMTLAVYKDALCFVKQRENQIVLTIGALFYYTDVEL